MKARFEPPSRRLRAQAASGVSSGNVTVRRFTHDGPGTEHVRVTSLAGASGRDFVLVAGIGVASDYYVRLALDLNRVGSVHAIDLPGFGGVPHPNRTLSIPDFAELVGATLEQLDLTDPVLIGHSMGAQVVTEVAAQHPEITSAVLIGPVVNDAERTIPKQAGRLLVCAGREPFAITLHVLISYVLCGPRWFFRVLPQMMRYPIEERLREVAAETLVLRGEHDGNCPRDWTVRLASAARKARAWEIPQAAHSVMYAHAQEVSSLTLEFLDAPEADETTNSLEQRPVDVSESPRRHPWKDLAEQIRGAVTSLRGMSSHDDELVAEGANAQIEAARNLAEQQDADGTSHEPVSLTASPR